jgi:hypothetical protein
MSRPNPRGLRRHRNGDGSLGIRAGGQKQGVLREVAGTSPVNLTDETIISLKTVCRLVPGRTGKGLALTTVFRWSLRGCRGRKLETFLVGGQRYTTREALDRFIVGINERPGDAPSKQSCRYQNDIEGALKREGL